jgi:drug/metabolite transporter (DMT)-like permease
MLGLVGNTLYQLFFINGLAITTATNSALILAGMPTVVTVAGGLLGLERTTGRERLGLAIATLGVVAVVTSRGGSAHTPGQLRGDLLMVAAVLCWASYTLGLRVLKGKLSALSLTTWTLITGTPGLVLAGLPGLIRQDWSTVSRAGWTAMAYSTLLSLVAAYVLWNRGVEKLGPARAVMFSLLTPFVATLIAMAILHERPTPVHAAGGLLIIAGVLLSRRVDGR